jgi:hypothetical protein
MLVSQSRVCTWMVTVGIALLSSASTETRGDDTPFVQKENGPFMVVAKSFRGVDAEKHAKALATELKEEHKLPTYLLRPNLGGGEQVAVLVGDAKTLQESESILKQVKAISPRCLADMPGFFQRRLTSAYRITNPMLPKPPIKQR